ncbi:MAG: Rnf-Nqr domain containing protein [Gammaproteobacteria bacterium]
MTDLLLIFFGACLVNNLVLDHLLAVDPAVAMADKIGAAVDLGLAIIVFAPVSAVLGHLFSVYILVPLQLEYLQLPALILVIVAGVTLAAALMQRISPRVHYRIRDLIPLLSVNCALLGIVLLELAKNDSLIAGFAFGLGTGAGVFLVVVAFAALQERLAATDVPQPFQGVAILLVTLGLFSMAFMGLAGIGTA